MQHDEPMPARPAPRLKGPEAQDIAAAAVPGLLSSQPPLDVAGSVAEDVVRDLLLQFVSHLTPLGGSDAHYRAGKESYDACRYTEALAHFTAALTYDPSNIYSQFHRARAHSMLGRPDLAIIDYTAIVQREPTYRAAYQNRGLNHWTNGDIVAADADFDQAQRLATTPAEHMFVNAIRLQMHGEFEAAVQAYSSYLTTQPDSTYSLYQRGGCYLKLNQADLALADYDVLLEYDPRNLSGLRQRGHIHLSAKRFSEAVADYRRATALAPEHADTHFRLGRAYDGLQEWDAAVASYLQATALAPEHANTHFRLGRAYQSLREWDAATASYLRCLELDPKIGAAHWSLGVIHAECGRPAEAIAAYSAYLAQQSDPDWQAKAQEQIDKLRAKMAAGAA